MKKLLSIVLILCMIIAVAAPLTAYATEAKSAEKSIDIYLIAGQSNATGSTKVVDPVGAYRWAPELRDGYSNIHYSGDSASTNSHRVLPWQKVTLGLGHTDVTYMGPEAGMAKAMSAYYNPTTGKEAGIIKYAVGGSSIQNKTTGTVPETHGNWAPPSYVATLDSSAVVDGVTGAIYASFLAQVEKSISELKAYGGYTKINLCGLYWMQGCNDKTVPDLYAEIFAMFAASALLPCVP